ncbi:hypothetical protein Bhyg_09636 [Pseudolycoriella hygida]|uniref:Uncharacterized protein n=1 Tax=Pseudolycoriella hygida TaxID=35572 RepID=A0A9Q0S454_9DIPT|nr:hypothetical protein Bhyg_09636 [Pseudolycoriella hygida]
MILKSTVLMFVLTKIALSYKQYKYLELCPGNKFKSIFDTITNNKPEVKIGELNYESAALVHYNSITNRKVGSCEFNVKLVNPGGSNGIFVNIKKLQLREYSYDHSCRDYLRFTYKNATQTREICGNIQTTVHNNLIRNFFDIIDGELKVEIHIDPDFTSSDNEKEVQIVFTAYTQCYGSSRLRCSQQKCISDVFRDDEIINCPPPDCLDENNCKNYEKPSVVLISSQSESSGTAHIIVPLVILVIAALAVIMFFCKKKKTTANSQRANTDHIAELRDTTRSDLDSYLEFEDVGTIPRRPMPLRPGDEYRHMPLVSPDRQYDGPMPSAPPIGLKDDPPPYDELFNTNQTKRTNV